ncbi:MAG: cupin domain-containing protein [Burkholderiaceae bacterium]
MNAKENPAALGRIEDLPSSYIDALSAQNTTPLWPQLRSVMPHGCPTPRARAHRWHYADIRPLLHQAGEMTPIEQAERRVLMLANPGMEGKPFATASIFFGLQLILPGEQAPNHRHSVSAARMVMEGAGAWTTVEGQRCPMEKGDLILTPAQCWHEHGHDGDGPMVWLDALDLPLAVAMDSAYAVEAPLQNAPNQPDPSQTHYRRAGMVPARRLERAAHQYPQYRYPWTEVRAALQDMATVTPVGEPVQLAYVNPETGAPCLPILGFSALMLRPGEQVSLGRTSASCGYLIVAGSGKTLIGDTELAWEQNDVLAMPGHSTVVHRNDSGAEPAFLIQIDDGPMQRALGYFERFE